MSCFTRNTDNQIDKMIPMYHPKIEYELYANYNRIQVHDKSTSLNLVMYQQIKALLIL